MLRSGFSLRLLAACALGSASVFAADPPPAWEKPSEFPAESDFLYHRMLDPQNHFLLNGNEGFMAGNEFYQNIGDFLPFLWPTHPYQRFGTDRSWQNDSATVVLRSEGTALAGETWSDGAPYGYGDASWSPAEGLRLHGGLDQTALYAQKAFPQRVDLIGADRKDRLAWVGEDLPMKSQATLGAAFARRGSSLAAQFNQGEWWTTSPATGQLYPWTGFNADLLYKEGEDFDLTLMEQQWSSASDSGYFRSTWRRSEIDLGFLGSSEGSWVWRFDIGYQRRFLQSDSAFQSFEEKGYPFRFRYRQDWTAPDSMPLRMLSQGSFGVRDEIFMAQHSTELREPFGSHQPMQFIRGYYRHPLGDYAVPRELGRSDSTWGGETQPGDQNRGVVVGAEYREVAKHFLVGLGGDYAMEWELPLFTLTGLDSSGGYFTRTGSYQGSDYVLMNASGKAFASGELPYHGNWSVHGGWRGFWGRDADKMEFRPSPYWAGAGLGWALPGLFSAELRGDYVGPKEVRGWGPAFKVPAHFESQASLTKTFSQQFKAYAAAFDLLDETHREQPNGNPLGFRILAGFEGSIK